MQYTEENYTELYNNLPKGLRELVLSGELSNLSNAIAMKYSLTPEQSSDLEPAIEDVTLGLVTIEELSGNIAYQLGLENDKADIIAREVIKTILGDYTEELRLTRKYKIELDEKIRKSDSTDEVETLGNNLSENKKTVAGNIINITRESGENTEKKTLGEELLSKSKTTDSKVADWYAGGKTKTQMEMDSFTGNVPVTNIKVQSAPAVQSTPVIQSSKIMSNIPSEVQENIEIPEVRKIETIRIAEKKEVKDVWENIINQKIPNIIVAETSKAAPQYDLTSSENNTSGVLGVEKSLVQVEQQIFTLTNAINKLLTQDTFTKNTAKNNIEDIFNDDGTTDKFAELNKKVEDLSKKIDQIGGRLQVIESINKNPSPKPVVFTNTNNIFKEEKVESKIPEKKSLSIDDLLLGRNKSANTNVAHSKVSESSMNAIFENKKAEIDTKININSKPIEMKPETVKIDKVEEVIPSKTNRTIDVVAKQKVDILADLDFIKNINSKNESNSDLMSKTNLNNLPINSLKEEIINSTDDGRMKSLQDKIRALNKGVGYSSSNVMPVSSDPYRQAI